ncbi:MAG: hypothetical protein AAFP03_03860 [Cyanobacteria bacterium J06598_3]
MSQDDGSAPNAVQWLAEIQALQRQVAELQEARDRAYASADNLRQLYDAEAQQRRRDAESSQRKIDRLQKTLGEFHSPAGDVGQLKTEISRIQSNRSVEQLQAQLVSSRQQCEQLKKLLSTEQEEHEQTRQSLTAALGDAVDLLAKERSGEARSKAEQ